MDAVIEKGPARRTFARAVEWPGWCRSGRDEVGAMAALAVTRSRYAALLRRFHLRPPDGELRVVERVTGTAVTDFGAIATVAAHDLRPWTAAERDQLIAVLDATWGAFSGAYGAVPDARREVKPKMGRAPAAVCRHVLESDLMHLSGVTGEAFRKPDDGDLAARLGESHSRLRGALLHTAVGEGFVPVARHGLSWTPRFALQRSAWHALDHAWELEDR